MTGRDDAGAHFGRATDGRSGHRTRVATFTARRRGRALRARPDGDAGRARRRPLHPAPLLPPRVQAARQLQGLHGAGRTATRPRLHDAGAGRPRGRERTPSRSTRTGARWCRCCSSRATTSARPARRAATACCRRWPTTSACCPTDLDHFFPNRPVDASHPDILLDFNRCILCELCVRASAEVDGKTCSRSAGRGMAKHLIVNAESGRLADTDIAVDRQGGGRLPGRRDPAQARRLRRADRQAPLRPAADQRAGAGRCAAARQPRGSRDERDDRPAAPPQAQVATTSLAGCFGCHMSLARHRRAAVRRCSSTSNSTARR